MKALLKEGRQVAVVQLPKPQLSSTCDVRCRVLLAGLCRTDIYAARGELPTRDPVILGHEFCAVVDALGSAVTGLAVGDRVAVMPVLSCGSCESCTSGKSRRCPHATMLGLEHHGAFAEYVVVPASAVYQIPEAMSDEVAAYIEPIAASMAVLQTHLAGRVLVYGQGRIAQLTARIIEARTGLIPALHAPGEPLPSHHFDVVIETRAENAHIAAMIEALAPGGTLVAKSRPNAPVMLDWRALVQKELKLEGVHYGDFGEAIEFAGELELSGLFGRSFSIDEYKEAFEHCVRGVHKHFLRISER